MKRFLCRTAGLEPGRALLFEAVVRGERRDCVLLPLPSGPVAYVNVCAHRNQPVVVRERPLDGTGRTFECEAHGAVYEAATGDCIEGPCTGARLLAVPLVEEEGALWAEDDDLIDDSVYAQET